MQKVKKSDFFVIKKCLFLGVQKVTKIDFFKIFDPPPKIREKGHGAMPYPPTDIRRFFTGFLPKTALNGYLIRKRGGGQFFTTFFSHHFCGGSPPPLFHFFARGTFRNFHVDKILCQQILCLQLFQNHKSKFMSPRFAVTCSYKLDPPIGGTTLSPTGHQYRSVDIFSELRSPYTHQKKR